MGLAVHGLDHLVVNVADVERSAAWYVRVLGVERQDFCAGAMTRTAITFGTQKINLRPSGTDVVDWFTGAAPTPGSDDLCFLTDAAPDEVAEHLRRLGVAIAEGPCTKQGARGPIRSVYCRDPDGNLIEIASYG